MKQFRFFLLNLIFLNCCYLSEIDVLESILEKAPQEAFSTFNIIFKKNQNLDDIDEYNKRRQIFLKNLEEVKIWNSNQNNKWKKGINQFSDLTMEEFESKYLIKNMLENEKLRGPPFTPANGFKYKNFIVPENGVSTFKPIDWSKYTGSIRDQLDCGSCYAQVGITLIESTYLIKTGKSVRLSVQQIVDCNKLTSGCNGGWVTNVGLYAKSNGLMTEAEYPYLNAVGSCNYNPSTAKQYIDGMTGHGDLLSIKYHAYHPGFLYEQLKYGPVGIAIDGNILKEYKKGVWNAEGCEKINHAVTVTGFGIENDGTPYFLIRNSWGTTWGENGYMKIRAVDKDSAGNCFTYYYTYGAFYNGN